MGALLAGIATYVLLHLLATLLPPLGNPAVTTLASILIADRRLRRGLCADHAGVPRPQPRRGDDARPPGPRLADRDLHHRRDRPVAALRDRALLRPVQLAPSSSSAPSGRRPSRATAGSGCCRCSGARSTSASSRSPSPCRSGSSSPIYLTQYASARLPQGGQAADRDPRRHPDHRLRPLRADDRRPDPARLVRRSRPASAPRSASVMTAGLVMGIMLIPFVSSLSDDIITAVPRAMRDGSLGLGATQSETITQRHHARRAARHRRRHPARRLARDRRDDDRRPRRRRRGAARRSTRSRR